MQPRADKNTDQYERSIGNPLMVAPDSDRGCGTCWRFLQSYRSYICLFVGVGVAIFYISSSNSLQSVWLAIFRLSLLVSHQGIPKSPSAVSGDGWKVSFKALVLEIKRVGF